MVRHHRVQDVGGGQPQDVGFATLQDPRVLGRKKRKV